MGKYASKVLLGLGLTLSATSAYAYSGGIAGYSGNPNNCTSCHGGGTNPAVSFVAPASVAPGSTTQIVFRISGLGANTAGVDISAVGGTLQNVLATTKLLSGEIVHRDNLKATNGTVDVSFQVVAPASGSVKLYASALSANGAGTNGDGTKTASVSIPVVAPAPSPIPTMTPNQAPVAKTTGPYTTTLGMATSLDGSLSADADGSIASYSWNFGDGSVGSGAKINHTYLNSGVYNVSLVVKDNLGLMNEAKTTVTVNPPANLLPTANAGGPYSALVAVPVNFDGSMSKDPDGSIASYSWDFGDGASASGAKNSHAYAKEGTYTATLSVTDNLGAVGKATVKVVIGLTNQAPVADAGGPYMASRRGRIAFDGSGSSDADGTIVSYHWDFGDGTSADRMSPVHRFPVGTFEVTLTVTDDAGASHSAKISVTNAGRTSRKKSSSMSNTRDREHDRDDD